jgi:hypothetical protein
MNDNMIFETLKELSKKETSTSRRKDPSYIYLDKQDNQIKEIPLSKLDSAGSTLINRTFENPLKLIHDSIFGN